MPTRKQRRRREKDRRHEWEYVYVDDEGNEVDVEPEEPAPARKERDREKPQAKRDGRRPAARGSVRPVQPPSWRRVGKRLLIFAPLMYVVFGLTARNMTVGARLVYVIGYSLLFVPFLYWIDRLAYRRYLRQTGQEPPSTGARRRF